MNIMVKVSNVIFSQMTKLATDLVACLNAIKYRLNEGYLITILHNYTVHKIGFFHVIVYYM